MTSNKIRNMYEKLVLNLEELSRLCGIMGIMHWDQEVIMPKGAGDSRAKQMAALAGIIHEKSINQDMGYLSDKLIAAGKNAFSEAEWCNIKEAKRDFDLKTKIPKGLIQELAELSSRGHQVWAIARQENRFVDFAPVLERLIDLKIKWASFAFPNLEAYDANLDIYERGIRMERITPIFDKLKCDLIPLIRSINNSEVKPDTSFLEGNFLIDKQENLAKSISRDMGFDFNRGRIDVSIHPFCGGGHPTDVRITTRYRTDNYIESLFAVIQNLDIRKVCNVTRSFESPGHRSHQHRVAFGPPLPFLCRCFPSIIRVFNTTRSGDPPDLAGARWASGLVPDYFRRLSEDGTRKWPAK